jgi:hypothetical protein
MDMEERFDRLEARLTVLSAKVAELSANMKTAFGEVANGFRAVTTRLDVHSRQIAGLSKRIDGLTDHQKRFAGGFAKRLEKVEDKAQVTIEGHQAIRSEMHREFATLRRDLDLRVRPIELAVKRGRHL